MCPEYNSFLIKDKRLCVCAHVHVHNTCNVHWDTATAFLLKDVQLKSTEPSQYLR